MEQNLASSVLRLTRGAGVAIVVALLALDLRAQQRIVVPAQPFSGPAPKGTAAITGTVTDGISGRPIAGAIVALENRVPGQPRRSYSQVTTPTGRFAFIDLPAADTYFLTAGKTGYLDGGYNQPDPRAPGAPISLADGQWMRDVRVTLALPGSISGIVSDERGEPIVGAYVRVLPQVLITGRTQWLAGAVAVTDDRGAYRIAGLGPGKYVVSVPSVQATLPAGATIKPPGAGSGTSMADARMAMDAAKADRLVVDAGGGEQLVVGRYAVPPPPTANGQATAYPIVFYPNAATPANATPVELRASEDRAGIDFGLQPVPTARVSGVVQGPSDAIGTLLLRLVPIGLEELGQGSEAATTVTFADGRFTFLNVPAGSYVLEARHALLQFSYTSMKEMATALPAPVPMSTRNAAAGGVIAAPPGVEYTSLRDGSEISYWAQLRIDVSGPNIDDVVLPLRRPATMTGRVVWAPGVTPPSSMPLAVLEPADGRLSLGMPSTSRPLGGATFTIDGLMAGEYVLRMKYGLGTVESIVWDGQDYADRLFDTSNGQDITDVVVTLTTKTSSISGMVNDNGATLTTGAAVIAFPIERDRWKNYGFSPIRIKSVLTTAGGRFQIDGLPPGEYNVIAVPAAQERAWLDPAFLAGAAARASHVRVEGTDAKIAGLALSVIK